MAAPVQAIENTYAHLEGGPRTERDRGSRLAYFVG
jgi:hypothetical protein